MENLIEKQTQNFISKNRYLLCILGAYFIWGSLPLYFHFTNFIRSIDLMMYRIFFSFIIISLFVFAYQKPSSILKEILSNKDYRYCPLSGLMIGLNWSIYLVALKKGLVIETSLGYFVAPILTIFFGIFLYLEKLNKVQLFYLMLTCAGVIALVLFKGSFPQYAFYVAITFCAYVLLRKKMKVNAFIAMWLEMLTLFPIAVSVLIYQINHHGGLGFELTFKHVIILLTSGLVSFLPILLLTLGLKNIKVSLIGSLQYISPTCQFILGIFMFDNEFSLNDFFAYCIIWFSIILFITTSKA